MLSEEIFLEDIKCKDIINNIELCMRSINTFVNLINTELAEDEKLRNPVFRVFREKYRTFEDDGNTEADGYRYNVYWAVSFNNKRISISHIDNNLQEECLYFKYEQTERIRDHKADKLRFLSLYVCGVEYPRHNEWTERIDYNNDNYEVNSIINVENAATCILEIKEIKKRVRLTESLKKRLKELENK